MGRGRPKVAFLAPCVPGERGVGWSQRTYQFLAAYAGIANVHLFAVDLDGSGVLCSRAAVARLCRSVTVGSVSEAPAVARAALACLPLCDAVHVTRTFLFDLAVASRRPGVPLLVDLDEDPVKSARSFERCSKVLGISQARRPSPAHCRAELAAVRAAADLIWVSSPAEADRVGRVRRPVRCIPNPATIRRTALDPARAPARTLLFVGNLNFLPNIDGVGFLIDQVLPRVRAEVPGVKLRIVGRGPGADVAGRAGSGIRVVLDAARLEPHYAAATVAVAPIRHGAGTRVKILEAFGQGVPVVSTTLGCEGLGVQSGRHLLIGDDARSFAGACVRLLANVSLRVRMAGRARALAERSAPGAIQSLIARDVRRALGASPTAARRARRRRPG